MKTSLQPLVFEKRRPDRGISFRKAINGADASNPTQPKFSPDFESTAPSKWKEFLGGFNHALGGLPPVNPTTKKGLVSESDKLEGPIKYIEDAKSSFGVDLSYFYHWGVAQSRYHRAQLINGDFRNPALKGMQSNAGKITDVMQRRAAELRSGLSADPNSNEYKKAMVTLNDLDKHDHYVGTLRVLQAYRKLRQGVPSGEIYSPDHWNADDYDGEKDYRDHPWLQHQSLSTWQQDDPLFVYAKKFLTKPETIARGSSKTAEDGDIRGYSKISVPNFNPVTPFITNQSDADAWSDHGQYFYQKEVRVPQQPPAFENLITDPSLNFESIKNLINDDKFSKGSFAKKIELAKIAADRYAEQCWAHYSGKLDLTKHSWFQRLKELGLNVNLSNVSAIDSLDSLETINPNELVFHKLARQLVENHQQDFKRYLSNIYMSELLSPSGANSQESLKNYKDIFDSIKGYDDVINLQTNSGTRHWHKAFDVIDGPMQKIQNLWNEFDDNTKRKKRQTPINPSTFVPELKNDFLKLIHDTYSGNPESGYNEANDSKSRQHADFWANGFNPQFSFDGEGFPLSRFSTKKGFFLQKSADRYQMLHMLLNALSTLQKTAPSRRLNALKTILGNEELGHLRYGKLLQQSKGITIFPRDLIKNYTFNFNYNNFYSSILESLVKSSEAALCSAQFVLAHTTTILGKPLLLNKQEYHHVQYSLKNYLQDDGSD